MRPPRSRGGLRRSRGRRPRHVSGVRVSSREDGVDDPDGTTRQMTNRDGGPRGGAHDGGGPAAEPLTGVRRRVRASPWMGDVGPGRRWSAVPGVRRAARLQPRRRPDQAGGPAAVARPGAVRRAARPTDAARTDGRGKPECASGQRPRRPIGGAVGRCPHGSCSADRRTDPLRCRRRSRDRPAGQPAAHVVAGALGAVAGPVAGPSPAPSTASPAPSPTSPASPEPISTPSVSVGVAVPSASVGASVGL